MRCPNCGAECTTDTCALCGSNLSSTKSNIHKTLIILAHNKLLNFIFPLSSIIFMLILGLLFANSTVDGRPMKFSELPIYMIITFIFIVLPYDIVRWFIWGRKKYFKKISARLDIYKKAQVLIAKSNNLADTINTTTDRETFETSLSVLKETLKQLIEYEKYGVFSTTLPSQDLKELLAKENIARSEFESRAINKPFDYTIKSTNSKYSKLRDTIFAEAGRAVIDKSTASIGTLQRVLKIGFNQASRLMDQLCECGVIGPEIGTSPRKVLMNRDQFETLLIELETSHLFSDQNIAQTCHYPNYDDMQGHDFEYFCAGLLRTSGFINVEVTQGSGDHGIDILAEKDDITYAIQCKCYSSNIGNAAVQQAHTGKSLYRRDVAVVMTNRYFTQQAKDEAAQLHVKLWDRDKLDSLINHSNS